MAREAPAAWNCQDQNRRAQTAQESGSLQGKVETLALAEGTSYSSLGGRGVLLPPPTIVPSTRQPAANPVPPRARCWNNIIHPSSIIRRPVLRPLVQLLFLLLTPGPPPHPGDLFLHVNYTYCYCRCLLLLLLFADSYYLSHRHQHQHHHHHHHHQYCAASQQQTKPLALQCTLLYSLLTLTPLHPWGPPLFSLPHTHTHRHTPISLFSRPAFLPHLLLSTYTSHTLTPPIHPSAESPARIRTRNKQQQK